MMMESACIALNSFSQRRTVLSAASAHRTIRRHRRLDQSGPATYKLSQYLSMELFAICFFGKMSSMAKKRRAPRTKDDRTFRGFRMKDSSWETLQALSARYQAGLPFVTVSPRVVIEALIRHADAHEISFAELCGEGSITSRR